MVKARIERVLKYFDGSNVFREDIKIIREYLNSPYCTMSDEDDE